jgi:hypothetical protein
MRLLKIMELYAAHVRKKFLKLPKDKDNLPDPEDGSLTFFRDMKGDKCKSIGTVTCFFKRQIINAGQTDKSGLINIFKLNHCVGAQ